MIFALLEMAEELVSYEHADHWWHRLNPLSKLALFVGVLGFGIFAAAPATPWFYGVTLLATVWIAGELGGIPIYQETRKRKGFIIAIVVMYGIMNLFFGRGNVLGRELFYIPPWFRITDLSVQFAISKTSFLLSSLLVVIIVLKSTRLSDMTYALTRVRVPFALSMIAATSIRCIPMVTSGLRISYNAQRARGLELDRGGFRERVKQIRFLLMPLMVMLLKTVDQMTIIFQSRGLDFASRPRTHLRELPLTLKDWVLIAINIGGLAALSLLIGLGIIKWQFRG
jgi:energy-coupling factor transporter transmembrane protein EcfT